MSMIYGMFDAMNIGTDDSPFYDRAVNSEFFARFFSTVCNNGVVSGGFKVSSSTGLTLKITPGAAMIEGRMCFDDSDTYVTVPAVSASRSDLIVIRLDYSNRNISIAVASGQGEPVRNGNIYELAIAKVNLPAACTSITSDMIVDLRSNPSMCGYAGASVSGLPTITTSSTAPANPSAGDIWFVTE